MNLMNLNVEKLYINEEQVASLFPPRPAECHKGNFGYVALIGGSIEYSGAIRLAAQANSAMRSGAGVATVAAPRSICPLIAPQIMEATLYPLSDRDGHIFFNEEEFAGLVMRYDCIAFGMGIGNSDETLRAVEYLLANYNKTLIIDADGLNAMARLDHEIIRNTKARLVLTPHAKEFSKLSGMTIEETKADPVKAAEYLAAELNAVVLLKGSTTVVAGQEKLHQPAETETDSNAGEADSQTKDNESDNGLTDQEDYRKSEHAMKVLATNRGCPGMATAGSGDVLSGILSALCVNAEDLVLATAAGAYINGAAGELAQSRHTDVTMTSADTAGCVAEVIETILNQFRSFSSP